MESITGLVRSLSLLLLAAAFVELLIPKGHLSSLVRLIFGLLLLAALLSPILSCFTQEVDLEQWAGELLPSIGLEEDYARQGSQLAAALEQEGRESYREELEQQILALLQEQMGVGGVEVFVDLGGENQPESLDLYFWDTSPASAEACLQLLQGRLGLAEEQMKYQILSGEAVDEKE